MQLRSQTLMPPERRALIVPAMLRHRSRVRVPLESQAWALLVHRAPIVPAVWSRVRLPLESQAWALLVHRALIVPAMWSRVRLPLELQALALLVHRALIVPAVLRH